MKYVMFQIKAEGRPTQHLPVIFTNDFVHKDIAQAIEHVKVMPEGPFAGWWMWPKAVSAGFINSDGICSGRSESLNLCAHRDDTAIVKEFNNGRELVVGFTERPTK